MPSEVSINDSAAFASTFDGMASHHQLTARSRPWTGRNVTHGASSASSQMHPVELYVNANDGRCQAMKVAIYGRVSRHDKDQTTENQMLKLREFAERHGWSVVKEYSDVASGAAPSRPHLDAMLNAARGRQFDAILVVRIDRLGRSVINLKNIALELQHNGVDLVCTDQPIDTSSAAGKLFFTMLSAFAEFELDVLRDRTKDGLARARLQGKRIGRPRYPVSTEDIVKLKSEGLTFDEIAAKVGMSPAGVKKRLRVDRATKGVQEGS